MRPWAVALVLAAMLAATVLADADRVVRPHALLAEAQGGPFDGGPVVDLAWPADGKVACVAACRLGVPHGMAGELWVAWDGSSTVGFIAALDGVPGIPAFDAVRVGRVEGANELRLWGRGKADLVVVAPVEGVPELVALVPANLGAPLGGPRGHGDPSLRVPGCLEEEVEELAARGCLRFTTGLANLGGTALDLSSDARTGEARMTQALPDGNRLVGLAAYHASHGHFHYAGFVAFRLYAHDAATGLRGDPVASSGKTGFCMVDFGKVTDAPTTQRKTFWRDGCAPGQDHLAMGINPGWYDIYRWFLPEQSLDPTGLPAGTYELVVTIDPSGTLVEGNPLDNSASVVFAWHDGVATTIAEHGLYHLSPQPS